MPTATALPRWDMTPYFPGLESRQFESAVRALAKDIDSLKELFDREKIDAAEGLTSSDSVVEVFETVIAKYNQLLADLRLVDSYIYSFTSTDTRDESALAKESELEKLEAELGKLGTRFTAWLGSLPVEELIQKSKPAQEHAYALQKAWLRAKHLMSPPEEALATDMGITGSTAWAKLHGKVTSQLGVEIELQGKTQTLPMSVIRSLAYDKDRVTRRKAYEAEVAAWKKTEVTIAAAMNSIKGEVQMLSKRRKWESPLDSALFNANINRQTLDAMMEAARESYPIFRRYLRAKAKIFGEKSLPWYDIFAPVGGGGKEWDYYQGTDFVVRQFSSYSDKLGEFAARSFLENWIDAEPRPGKVDGAFCMGTRKDESRIMLNFKPAFGSISTLAHELGHGYHNLCLAERTQMQRATPMTLAETASIFCETIVRRAALKELSREEGLEILEASLQGSCQTVVDISSRFLFESAVFEKREARDLSAQEFCDLMTKAQKDTYGDGLNQDYLHPYMWAVKPHYYSSRSFYNFPYMFGLLFGLGLYARYEADPDGFKKGYDDLLSSTGLADAATLASRFGIEIRTPDFWRSSLKVVEKDVVEFEARV